MSQHDYNVANNPGATVRADINALAEAIASLNGGSAAPSVTFPHMLWFDEVNAQLDIRNTANTAWIVLLDVGSSAATIDDTVLASALSGNWFGTSPRIPRISTAGITDIGGSLNLHGDAADVTSFQAQLQRATGANGVLTLSSTGTGGMNFAMSGPVKKSGLYFGQVPIGGEIDWPVATAPAGWLLEAGQLVSRTTYAALFAIIGTTYGVGDGSTTFGVPDKRGRVTAGVDNMGGTAANRLTGQSGGVAGTLAAVGGEEQHTLSTAEIPAHTHANGDNGRFSAAPGGTSAANLSSTGAVLSGSTGGGGAHNNVQPVIVQYKIIFAGV